MYVNMLLNKSHLLKDKTKKKTNWQGKIIIILINYKNYIIKPKKMKRDKAVIVSHYYQ